ncbi:MAG: hypothetical protein ABIO24_02410, partial [Saprospiraceae bacterium]
MGKNIADLRQLLALETTKQEALTLALQLMDASIRGESLKTKIAQLLSEYTRDAEIFRFLENRLLTTIVPRSFDPSFASNICRTLEMNEVAAVYELLNTHAGEIQTFYTAWVKVARPYFQDAEKADTAFCLLTSQGIAKIFVQSVAQQSKGLWDKAALDAALLFQKEGLASNALPFFTLLKTDLTQYFQVEFKEKVFSSQADTTVGDEIADLIEGYLEDFYDKKGARKREHN